jgi:low affinity Fe/Cu permease
MTLIAASTKASGLGSADMEMMLWNIALSVVVAVMGFFLRGKIDELDRLGILLNKTREEVAREHVTRAEVNTMVDRLGDRFDKAFERLEAKVDEMRKV